MHSQIDTYLSLKDLVPFSNRLECVCLLATGENKKEIQQTLDRLAESIDSNQENKNAAANLNFVVFLSGEIFVDVATTLGKRFKSVQAIRSGIPKKYDFYYRNISDVPEDVDLSYGLASGANYCFFEITSMLERYNTTLFVECDCYFFGDWLARINNYTKYAGGFWKAGPSYGGLLYLDDYSNLCSHLNGGCCLYATGSTGFMKYLKYLHAWFLETVRKRPNLSYDCAYSYASNWYLDKGRWDLPFHAFVVKQELRTNLLLDLSPPHDASLDLKAVQKKTQAAIVHKKIRKNNSIAFMHIPKAAGTFFFNSVLLPYWYRSSLHNSNNSFTNFKVYDGDVACFSLIAATEGIELPYRNITTSQHISLGDLTELNHKIKEIIGFKVFSTTKLELYLPEIEKLKPDIDYLTILRSPLLREQSLFYYLKDKGTWEKTYNRLESCYDFNDFLLSDKVSSNWLTRWFAGNVRKKEIKECDYERALKQLSKCKIIGFADSKAEVAKAVKAFSSKYGYTSACSVYKKTPEWMFNRNDISTKIAVTDEAVQRFNELNYWDNKLFNHFRKQGDCLVS